MKRESCSVMAFDGSMEFNPSFSLFPGNIIGREITEETLEGSNLSHEDIKPHLSVGTAAWNFYALPLTF